jgi:hypothetical protein
VAAEDLADDSETNLDLWFAKILCAPKIARFPAVTAVPSRFPYTLERQVSLPEEPRAVYLYI